MSIDWAEIAIIGGVISALLVGFPAIFLLLWWLARQYFLCEEKVKGRLALSSS